MTKDLFRQQQKVQCVVRRGNTGKNGVYGCSCCRRIGNLNHFKKHARKVAKGRLRNSFAAHVMEFE